MISTSPADIGASRTAAKHASSPIEHARPALEHQRLQAGDLDERAVGRQVAAQHDEAARRTDRLLGRLRTTSPSGPPWRARCSASVRPDSVSASPCRWPPSSNAFSTASVPPTPKHVDGEVAPAGLQVGDQRRAREHFGDVVEREADAGLVRDRGQMQARIGRAAGRRHDGRRILERFAGDEIARQRAAVAPASRSRARRRAVRARGARNRPQAASPTRQAQAPVSPTPSPWCWR